MAKKDTRLVIRKQSMFTIDEGKEIQKLANKYNKGSESSHIREMYIIGLETFKTTEIEK